MSTTTFPDFVAHFPPVTMPVILGEDTHHVFSKENEPLSQDLIEKFILPYDGEGYEEEITEYVPCFAVADTEQFIALVWWKATMLDYSYTLATFNLRGELIDAKVIAFTKVLDKGISRAVATINEEHEIAIATGIASADGIQFDPTTSETWQLEIMATGEIV